MDDATRDTSLNNNVREAELAKVYRPIVKGFIIPASFYYLIVVILHYFDEPLEKFIILGGLAAITSVSGFLILYILKKRKTSFGQLELYSAFMFSLVFINVLSYHLVHLEVPKLIYFVLLTLAVATAGVSMRVVLAISALSLTTAIALAGQAGMAEQIQFAYIAFASAIIAIGMTYLMRLAINREIRARLKLQRLHAEARRAADIDFLTRLPNRRCFSKRMDELFARPETDTHLALGLVDLNGFKKINDLFGHAFGDELLSSVGQRIQKACGEDVFVARLGGDEFAILLERPMDRNALIALGRRLCGSIRQSYSVGGSEISITAAVGFARRQPDTAGVNALYEQADYALYRGKEGGSCAVEVYSGAHASKLEAVKKIEHELLTGVFEDEMHMEYQPLVDVEASRVVGFEALARWESPDLGRVSPDDFIRAAERCGVMDRLTPFLLRLALADATRWPDTIRLSFNLSARDLVSPETMDSICSILAESDFPSSRLDLEITETAIMSDFESARASIERLRALGARIALDDFGVGYANFQHIEEIKADKLKIDRSFVSNIGTSKNSGAVASTMIEMCNKLGLTCIIEGVETESELAAIRSIGGVLIQGYYFSKPMKADRVLPYLDQGVSLGADPLCRSA